MKRIILLLCGIICIQVLTVLNWFSCKDLKDPFHLRMFDVSLIVDDMTHNDQNIPIFFVRFFHNKVSILVIEFYRHFLRFWDIPFLTNLLTFVGFFGVACGLFYLSKHRKPKLIIVITTVLLVLQVVTMLTSYIFSYKLLFPALWFCYTCLAIFGIWQYLKVGSRRLRFLFCIILLLISIWWYLVFKHDIYNYCVKI